MRFPGRSAAFGRQPFAKGPIGSELGAEPAAERARRRGLQTFACSTVIRQGVSLAIVGVAIGLVASLVATQALTTLLYGVSARDPFMFVAAPVILAVVAVAASYLPSRRATRVSPVEALRTT